MRANQTPRPARRGRSTRLRLAAACLAAVVLPACTGDNTFTGIASGGLLGPEVQITAPLPNLTLGVGDSVEVTANLVANDGVVAVGFSGLFSGGQTAFTTVTVTNLPSPQDTTVTRVLRQAGTTTGNVRLIVEATDALGEKGADTVNVIIQ